MMGLVGLLWRPASPSAGWVGGKGKLCVVQARQTDNLAGIFTVCLAKGIAAHLCATSLSEAKTIRPARYDPTTFNP
jgi:hypothetical protein